MLRFPVAEFASGASQRLLPDASADRVTFVGSLAEYVAQGLDRTPEVRDPARQGALTDRFLRPALPGLRALFLELRTGLDTALREAQPARGGKPYPLGQCLEITLAVERRLEDLAPGQFEGAAAEACAAFLAFRAAGGEVRRAWGDLRGQFFQNALIVGTLYVDVANDTVVTTKPPVEILPFPDADFRPIADYVHFARIAQRYWKHDILPNHLAPELAPYFPLIQISPSGAIRVGPAGSPLLSLTLSQGFHPSERALAGPAMPALFFDSLRAALGDAPAAVAADPEQGRAAAIANCIRYRAEARFDSAKAFNRAMVGRQALNGALARLVAVPGVG
jgi:hypothetical protein